MRRVIPILLVLLLAACGQAVEAATTVPSTVALSTAPPATATVMTAPATIAPVTLPQAILVYVAIDSPEGWNDFARDFNAHPEGYANDITVEIQAELDFSGMVFVSLGSGFSGTLQGQGNEAYSRMGFYNIGEVSGPTLKDVLVYDVYDAVVLQLPTDQDYGEPSLLEQYGVEAAVPGGLFGAWVEALTLRNITFDSITAPNLPWLLGDSMAELTLYEVTFRNCHLPIGNSLLCGSTGSLEIDGLVVMDCGLYGDYWGAGLTYYVHGDLTLRGLYMESMVIDIEPDGGGSGTAMAHYSLTVNSVGGAARFENLELRSCMVDGAWSYFLTHNSSDTVSCSGLSAYDCRLMALPWPNSPWGDFTTDILFCYLESPAPETADIWLDACIFKATRGLEDYAGLGWYIGRSMSMISWDMPYTE